MLLCSEKPAGTKFARIGEHGFVSKRGDERTCGKCGKYWKTYNHYRAFDKSKEGKECLFFDEFIKNELARYEDEQLDADIEKYSRPEAI